jgi:hypothetical protein
MVDKIERLERALEAEAHARRLLEAQHTLEKREAELRLRDSVAEVEKATLFAEALQREHADAGDKAGELFEQKKILVKEVKQLRKKLSASEDKSADLTRLNAELSSTTGELHALVETLGQRNKVESEEALAATMAAAAKLVEESAKIAAAKEASDAAAAAAVAGAGAGPTGEDAGATSDKAAVESDFHWETKRSTNLENLDWLVPEQRVLLEEHSHNDAATIVLPPPSPAALPAASPSSRSASLSGADSPASAANIERRGSGGSVVSAGGTAGGKVDNGGPSSAEKKAHNDSFSDKMDKISFSKFVPSMNSVTSIFKDKDKDKDHRDSSSDSASSHGPSEHSGGMHMPKMSFFTSGTGASGGLFSHGASADAGGSPVALQGNPNAPRCHRCGGTVEGPKYSTCKCAIPAMAPLEPSEEGAGHDGGRRGSMSNFMGMLSRGIKTVTPHSSGSTGSFHGALQLDENATTSESGAAPAPAAGGEAAGASTGASLLFLEVEEGGENGQNQNEESVPQGDLLDLSSSVAVPEDNNAGADHAVAGTEAIQEHSHDELQAEI